MTNRKEWKVNEASNTGLTCVFTQLTVLYRARRLQLPDVRLLVHNLPLDTQQNSPNSAKEQMCIPFYCESFTSRLCCAADKQGFRSARWHQGFGFGEFVFLNSKNARRFCIKTYKNTHFLKFLLSILRNTVKCAELKDNSSAGEVMPI